MRPFYTNIRLENSHDAQPRVLEVRALVDMASFHLCLPAPLVSALGLEGTCFRFLTKADGSRQKCRYVGPVTLQCGSHTCFAGAVEAGEEVVIGTIPLAALGLTLEPATSQLVSVPLRLPGVYTK